MRSLWGITKNTLSTCCNAFASAWDEIESNGYTLGQILSVTGAELNSSENIRHSSTAQTWLVTEADTDDESKTVTITVTSHDNFVETYGKDQIK